MKPRNLTQWLSWLETLHPSEIELGLQRITSVAARLAVLSFDIPIITVAGTNGKGSTVAAISQLLHAQGKRVGAYTSPHLVRFNERICLAGVDASDEAICAALAQIEAVRGDISLTYFEYTTLAALLCFKASELDVIVLEVGLGGRLDAVNIVGPDLTIITNVQLDHQDWLGDTREVIGIEKAGVSRANVPLLIGEVDIPQSVIEIANSKGADLQVIGDAFAFVETDELVQWRYTRAGEVHQLKTSKPNLPLPSVALAIQAIAALGLDIDYPKITESIAMLALSGRFQQVQWQERQLILDVAHNPAATTLLSQKLSQSFSQEHAQNLNQKHTQESVQQSCTGVTHVVVGMLADKDAAEVLSIVAPQITGQWCSVDLPTARAYAAQELADIVQQASGSKAIEYTSVAKALNELLARSKPADRIVVTGSFYTVAAALELIVDKGESSE